VLKYVQMDITYGLLDQVQTHVTSGSLV